MGFKSFLELVCTCQALAVPVYLYLHLTQVEKVLGINTAAHKAGVEAGDVLVEVEGQLVTMMTHPQVITLFRILG